MSTRVATIATAPSRNASGAGSHGAGDQHGYQQDPSASGARPALASPANGTSIRKPWCAASSVNRDGAPCFQQVALAQARIGHRGTCSPPRRHRPTITA
jgi:hypothetical protein